MATAEVSTQVGKSNCLDSVGWIRANPLLTFCALIATFLVLGTIAVFSER